MQFAMAFTVLTDYQFTLLHIYLIEVRAQRMGKK